MSTLSVTSADEATWLFMAGLTVLSVFVCALLGVWRGDSVLGRHERPPARFRRSWPKIVAAAAVLWIGGQFLYGMFVAVRISAVDPKARIELNATDLAIVSIVPGVLGTVAIVVGLMSLGGGNFKRLGLSVDRLLAALPLGLLGILVAFPLVFWAMTGLDKFYRLIQYDRPQEHELLKEMTTAAAPVKVAMIVAAVLVAPIFEELLFRGGLQTVLRWLLGRAAPASSEAPGNPSSRGVWLAIIGSSMLFAAVHASWMAPAIFVLSVCIGYVYERTGNLWAAIVMHSLFNSINTASYLASGWSD